MSGSSRIGGEGSGGGRLRPKSGGLSPDALESVRPSGSARKFDSTGDRLSDEVLISIRPLILRALQEKFLDGQDVAQEVLDSTFIFIWYPSEGYNNRGVAQRSNNPEVFVLNKNEYDSCRQGRAGFPEWEQGIKIDTIVTR